MLIAAAALIASLPVTLAAPATDARSALVVAPVCQDVGPHLAGNIPDEALFRRRAAPDTPAVRPLTQEPPADAIATVLYSEGNCTKPVVISRGIGAAAPARK